LSAPSARDLVTGSVYRHIVRLATPTAIEQALLAITGLIHAFWMDRVGPYALSAVVMGTAMRIVLISPMMGLSAGGMAVVAHEIGARNRLAADRACTQTLTLVMLMALPLMAIGQAFAPVFLRWMGATGEIHANATQYVRIILWGLFFMECLPTMNGVIRGAGRPEFTLRITIVSRVVFFALEPILAFGLGPVPVLGVRGVALAEVVANAVGVGAQLVVLLSKDGCLTLRLSDLAPDWAMMRRVIRIALPNSAQRLSPNLANALFLRLVASLGLTVLAAYSVFTQIQTLVQGIVAGPQSAAATMVGQNLGGGQPERAVRSAWFGAALGAALPLCLYAIINLASGLLLPMLNRDPQVVVAARQVLTFALAFGSLNGLWLVLGNALAGAGDAGVPSLISIVSLWAVQLPVCSLLAHRAGLGPTGVWLGMILGNLVCAAGMAYRLRSGRWREIRV